MNQKVQDQQPKKLVFEACLGYYKTSPGTDFPKKQEKNPNQTSQGRTNQTS